MNITLAIHGGAGNLRRELSDPERITACEQALKETLQQVYRQLQNGASALDAVEHAVRLLEDCPLFNAGRGSVPDENGDYAMDASIMDGKNGKAGAVALVHSVKNPVSLARAVMEQTPHVFLAGQGADDFAKRIGLPVMDASYFFDEYRNQQWQKIKASGGMGLDHDIQAEQYKNGTVGAVALDVNGNLAAATSTGGMIHKMKGRIGDSPLIGVATFAQNDTCAVSCTGHGEVFIRQVVAHQLHCLMRFKNMSLHDACEQIIHSKLKKGDGGLIAIDKNGAVEMRFNTSGMFRAMKTNEQEMIGIFSA